MAQIHMQIHIYTHTISDLKNYWYLFFKRLERSSKIYLNYSAIWNSHCTTILSVIVAHGGYKIIFPLVSFPRELPFLAHIQRSHIDSNMGRTPRIIRARSFHIRVLHDHANRRIIPGLPTDSSPSFPIIYIVSRSFKFSSLILKSPEPSFRWRVWLSFVVSHPVAIAFTIFYRWPQIAGTQLWYPGTSVSSSKCFSRRIG